MKSTRLLVPGLAALLCAAIPSSAVADVTLKSKGSGTGMVGAATGDTTQYVKGLKMRTDQATMGTDTTIIIDASSRQMISLDHAKKEANVIDMNAISGTLSKAGVSDLEIAITPTGQTRQVAGSACTVYDLKIAVPMAMGNSAMKMVMSGPQCLSKSAPGYADFQAFYRAAAEKGFFLDPAQAKAQPAVAKAMADMQRKMSELGVPLATETNMAMEASGPMAEMMKKMSANKIVTEVVSVSTAPIADSLFEVPAGYKMNKR
jgi:hypothetical protein